MIATMPEETKRDLVELVASEFPTYIDRYNEKTYPSHILINLRTQFANPNSVTAETITEALRWKYGRLGVPKFPRNLPRNLQGTINNTVGLWKNYVDAGAATEKSGFDWWASHLPRTSFISYSFIIHLRTPQKTPIIDQHNFRAVQHCLERVGLAVKTIKRPHRWEHIVLVRDFMLLVLDQWKNLGGGIPKPSTDELDRFLMMYGKAIPH